MIRAASAATAHLITQPRAFGLGVGIIAALAQTRIDPVQLLAQERAGLLWRGLMTRIADLHVVARTGDAGCGSMWNVGCARAA